MQKIINKIKSIINSINEAFEKQQKEEEEYLSKLTPEEKAEYLCKIMKPPFDF